MTTWTTTITPTIVPPSRRERRLVARTGDFRAGVAQLLRAAEVVMMRLFTTKLVMTMTRSPCLKWKCTSACLVMDAALDRH